MTNGKGLSEWKVGGSVGNTQLDSHKNIHDGTVREGGKHSSVEKLKGTSRAGH
jgi:hypothetical protein